jgi:hypothetical protein
VDVKTAILISEFITASNAATDDVQFFRYEYADAIVTSGCFTPVQMSKPGKVNDSVAIPDRSRKALCNPHEALIYHSRNIRGSLNQFGDAMYIPAKI